VGHPGVDKVAFTGSTEGGSDVMRRAAAPIKRLTLELGGKSPSLVFADADLDDAVPSSCWSIYYAAGQSCEARSRVLVERSLHDEFVARFAEAASRIVVGDPLDAATHVGTTISRDHRARVHGFVERATAAGATAVRGGAIPDGPGAFYPPTLLTGLAADAEAVQEEIFGPVVVVLPFDDEDDAARLANDTRYGLFATIWTGDPARGHRLARRIQSGMVGLNMPYTAFPGIGFGGYKQSGFGRELSFDTLDAYTETKSVLVQTGTRPANPFRL
jgi:acyl-CoA reductase-like NAD-dependent aldehyde dehydrogenase